MPPTDTPLARVAAVVAGMTAGPWTQWVEHPAIYSGRVRENTRHGLKGNMIRVVVCDDDELEPGEANDNATGIALLRNIASALLAVVGAADRVNAHVNEALCPPEDDCANCDLFRARAALDAAIGEG